MIKPAVQALADPVLAILDGTPSMLGYWDRNLRCRYANRCYERWFGISGQSVIGMSLPDLLGPSLFAETEPYVRAALRGEAQEFERVVPCADGVRRPTLTNYLPHVVDGKVVGVIVQVTEVTRLHDAQRQLKQQHQDLARTNALLLKSDTALRQAQRLGQMGSWEWEIASDIVIWSEALYEIFGRDPNVLPPTFGEHPDLYTAESWTRLAQAVDRAVTTGLPYVLELEYVHSSGRRGWIEARGAVDRDETGAVATLRGTAQDITSRRLARDAAAQLELIAQLRQRLAEEIAKNVGRDGAPPSPPTEPVQPPAEMPGLCFDDPDFAWVMEGLAGPECGRISFGAV